MFDPRRQAALAIVIPSLLLAACGRAEEPTTRGHIRDVAHPQRAAALLCTPAATTPAELGTMNGAELALMAEACEIAGHAARTRLRDR